MAVFPAARSRMIRPVESTGVLMVSNSGDPGDLSTQEAEISLCIFPHLEEMVVVDGRSGLPGRPIFEVMRVDDVFDGRFFDGVQSDFGDLLRRDERPFLKMLALPQELEGLIRMHGLRAILSRLNGESVNDGEPVNDGEMPNVAVLILPGPFLTLDAEGLRESLTEMFGSQLQGQHLDDCVDIVSGLAEEERQATNGGRPSELTSLIRGDGTHYATLWQSGEGASPE